jgi:hypothetical protein
MGNGRKFGPRPADAPTTKCPACHISFKEGDFTTLVALGPGNDEEGQQKCKDNRPYNAVAIEIHWECSEAAYRE